MRSPGDLVHRLKPTGMIRARFCALLALQAWVAMGLALAPTAGAAPPDLSGAVRLSDERTFTRWANPAMNAPILELPKPCLLYTSPSPRDRS